MRALTHEDTQRAKQLKDRETEPVYIISLRETEPISGLYPKKEYAIINQEDSE